MKKSAVPVALVIILILVTKVCTPQTGKEIENPKKVVSSNSYEVVLNYDVHTATSIQPGILGINTGFSFKEQVDQDPDFATLSKNIRPSTLRFPGGTVANFYHPGSPGYGFVYNEVLPLKALHPLYVASQKMKENILENFIRLCKKSGAKATFCVNMVNGTPEEALMVMRRLKEAGIELAGVELGNELNLIMYREQFPNGETYKQKAKIFAAAIRKEFPEVKLGVIMGDEVYYSKLKTQRGSYQHQWSLALAKENFYDAVIAHYYPKCDKCDKTYLEDFFQVSWNTISPYKTNYLDTLAIYSQQIFPGKKVWITEWNTGDWSTFDNTFLQAAFTSQFLMKLAAGNTRYNNLFEITNYHFLGPDGLISQTKGTLPPMAASGKYDMTAPYFAFSYFSKIVSGQDSKTITSELTPQNNTAELVVQTFLNDLTITAYFVNSGNNRYTVNFSKQPVQYTLESIQGNVLSSAGGNTYFDTKYPKEELTPVKLDKKSDQGATFTIEPYSLGYIEFKPGK